MSSPIKSSLTESHQFSTLPSSTKSSNFHVGQYPLHTRPRPSSSLSVSSDKLETFLDDKENSAHFLPTLFSFTFETAQIRQHNILENQKLEIPITRLKSTRRFSTASIPAIEFSSQQASHFIISKQHPFDSDSEYNNITPPLSPVLYKDHSHISRFKSPSSPNLVVVTPPSLGARRSSSFSSASSRRGGSISKRGNSRQSTGFRDKRKGSDNMSNDSDKDSDRRDSGGDRDRDKLVVKSRQRTAIACNYCRRRKIRCSGNPDINGNEEDPRCNNCKRFNQECVFAPVSASVTTIPLVTQKQLYSHHPHNHGYPMYPPPPPTGPPVQFDPYKNGQHLTYGHQYQQQQQQHSSDGVGYGHLSQHSLGSPYPGLHPPDLHNYPPINSSINQLPYQSVPQSLPPPPLSTPSQQQLPHFSHHPQQPSYYNHAMEVRQSPLPPLPQTQQPHTLPSQQWQAPHPPCPSQTQSRLPSVNAGYSQVPPLRPLQYNVGDGATNQTLRQETLQPLTRQQHSPASVNVSLSSSLNQQAQQVPKSGSTYPARSEQSQPTTPVTFDKSESDQTARMRKSGRVSISDLLD